MVFTENKDIEIQNEAAENKIATADTENTEITKEEFDSVMSDNSQTVAKAKSSFLEWIELAILSIVLVTVLLTFFVRNSPVIGTSMYPTLEESDYLLISNLFYSPKTYDIITFQTPDNTEEPLVKRVIATGGQHIKIDFTNWLVWVDGELLDESYVYQIYKENGDSMYSYSLETFYDEDGNMIYEADVPSGKMFVMGDNRNNSKDSRTLGFVDERSIIGKVVFRYLPFNKIGAP